MRDLHDGLGGQLVSIVALSEHNAWEGDRIGNAARAALKDLRLVIDAMDDIDGDLMLALGAWRERTAAQLRSHGLPLEWRVLAPEGCRCIPSSGPGMSSRSCDCSTKLSPTPSGMPARNGSPSASRPSAKRPKAGGGA